MLDITITNEKLTQSDKGPGVRRKRVRDASGKMVTRLTLDFSSPTISDDLTYVFRQNVAKARRENKRVTGVYDRAPGEG